MIRRPVRDLMSPDPTCVEPWMDVRTLARLFESDGISGAPVVDQQGRLIGVVSKTDLLHRALEASEDYDPVYVFEMMRGDEDDLDENVISAAGEMRVEDFMTEDPVTAKPDDELHTVAAKMVDSAVHRIIIVEKDSPVGVLTSMDIVRYVAKGGE